ncbi:MAG: lamin tail domain-containing protein [Candidatus Omnitrophica bacterium]|nr:lamin tail domain-containing protein [Candidatus Omnitrophota bacterium]
MLATSDQRPATDAVRSTQYAVRCTLYAVRGFSILESILVVVLLALIVTAISPFFGTAFRVWQRADRQSEVMERARSGMDRLLKTIRQAGSVSSVTGSADVNGSIQLLDAYGSTFGFRRSTGSGDLEYDPPGSPTGTEGSYSTLADRVDSLTFTCYDVSGTTTTTTVADIRSIHVVLSASDEEDVAGSVRLTARATLRKDFVSYELVINEINYNSTYSGADERENEWIEIYNYGSTAVDVSGWEISDDAQTDSVLAAGGTTIIPAGGFAIITADPTDVYTNYSVDAGAIRLEVDDNSIGNGLNDNGETITLLDDTGSAVDAVTYSDTWGGDGDGDTVERRSATGGSSDATNWEESSETGGITAGSANSV